MATTQKNLVSSILMVGLLTIISLDSTVGQVGVCYGRLGNNLPCPSKVVSLYKKNNIKRMRLYDPHKPTLQALSGSDVELMLGVPEADLPELAQCQCNANSWVNGNITSYPTVKFRYIAAGNEVDPASQYAQFVLPAMQNIYKAICAAGLANQIKVSTSFKTDVLDKSYPPQKGEFKSNVTWYIKPIVRFLRNTSSPLLANVYPYFAYINDPKHINLSFALLQPRSGEYAGGVYYDNLFYAILDAFYAAVEKLMGAASVQQIADDSDKDIVVSESGYPTDDGHRRLGVDDESPSSVKNARIYNNNLMRVVKKGTPKRPGRSIETYIFAMFDENLKTGPEYEKHFGIFRPNGKRKYPLRFH